MAAVRSPLASADRGLQRSETALALPKQLDGWRQLAASSCASPAAQRSRQGAISCLGLQSSGQRPLDEVS